MGKAKPELKSKCCKCLKAISTEEFLANDHRCKKCNKKPNWIEEKRCAKCRHYPHKDKCNEPISRNIEPQVYCECEEISA